MELKLLPLPSPENVRGGAFTIREAKRLRAQLVDPSRVVVRNGIRYWLISDGTERVIPTSVYREAFIECPTEQVTAYEAHLDTFTANCRQQMVNYKLSAEERYEMQAAFGPNQTVVNVFAGQKYHT